MDIYKARSIEEDRFKNATPKDFSPHIFIPPPSREALFANNPSTSISNLISTSFLPTCISPQLEQPPYRRPLKRKHESNDKCVNRDRPRNPSPSKKAEGEDSRGVDNAPKSRKLSIDSPSTKASSVDATIVSSSDECTTLEDNKNIVRDKKCTSDNIESVDRVPGVWFDNKRQLWRAVYLHEDKRKTKSFRVRDSDYEQARKMAISWKRQQEASKA